ncbi:hypothetical protein ACH427_20310 [Streptomyces sp. NPDC020379]|uniref:hypothetical protein n=1 Tax=Streptomyces sp. NPDC020379 TaxID=3365071 RepID=UPI0037A23EED
MANPHQHPQQNPEGYDPAGSTQMFRAFVDESPGGGRRAAPAPAASGSRVGVTAAVIIAIVVVVAAVAWLALS